MNTLTWYNYDDTSVNSFNIYRAIPGFSFLFTDLSPHPDFRFSASGSELQSTVIDTTSIDTAVASLNAMKGIVAAKGNLNTIIYIRAASPDRSQNRLRLYKCKLIEDLGMLPQIIVPELNFRLIGSQSIIVSSNPYSFDDLYGSPLDSYYITSVASSGESIPSVVKSPMLIGPDYCILEARFIEPQGRPVKGVEVEISIPTLGISGLSSNILKTKSDLYGRISIPLMQWQQYRINAPAVGYSQFITVEDETFIDLTKCPSTSSPDFSPDGDPSGSGCSRRNNDGDES